MTYWLCIFYLQPPIQENTNPQEQNKQVNGARNPILAGHTTLLGDKTKGILKDCAVRKFYLLLIILIRLFAMSC